MKRGAVPVPEMMVESLMVLAEKPPRASLTATS